MADQRYSSSLLSGLEALFLQPRCPICLKPKRQLNRLCAGCELPDVQRQRNPRCKGCGTLLYEADERICFQCTATPPLWRQFSSLIETERALVQTVAAIKYHRRQSAVDLLSSWLERELESVIFRRAPDLIVPVPTRFPHLFRRGFCLPTLIAELIAERRLDRSLSKTEKLALLHTGKGARQAGSSITRRNANTRHSFKATPVVLGQEILLVDDIATSGSTLRAATRALLRAGAGSVSVFVMARGPRFRATTPRRV